LEHGIFDDNPSCAFLKLLGVVRLWLFKHVITPVLKMSSIVTSSANKDLIAEQIS